VEGSRAVALVTHFKIRRDKNALAVFDTRNGTKLRFAIGPYTKSKHPELVDIKITDYCAFACAFCYQASTIKGKHSTVANMQFIIDELKKAKVFEVALGGGEPTDHPDFVKILKDFHNAGIVPNFTTKSLGWVKRNWSTIDPYVGAFAYSAETVKDLDSADKMFDSIPKDRINIHYIMGLGSNVEFVAFMKRAAELNFRVTLLGYKTVGRGDDVEHVDYDWWIDAIHFLRKMNCCPTFSIDTPLAEQYQDELPVSKNLFHTREGFVSAYIDAVAMKMGASSFENLESLVPFDKDWVDRYAAI
jgi:hypothetical protein